MKFALFADQGSVQVHVLVLQRAQLVPQAGSPLSERVGQRLHLGDHFAHLQQGFLELRIVFGRHGVQSVLDRDQVVPQHSRVLLVGGQRAARAPTDHPVWNETSAGAGLRVTSDGAQWWSP